MKVTDKKFLNVHQTIGPLTVASAVTSSNSKDGTNSSAASAASGKADKLLVSSEV